MLIVVMIHVICYMLSCDDSYNDDDDDDDDTDDDSEAKNDI